MKDSMDVNLFNAALATKGMTREELAKKLGITPFSLYQKVKRGGDFRKNEILILYSIFSKKVVDAFLF